MERKLLIALILFGLIMLSLLIAGQTEIIRIIVIGAGYVLTLFMPSIILGMAIVGAESENSNVHVISILAGVLCGFIAGIPGGIISSLSNGDLNSHLYPNFLLGFLATMTFCIITV